jgi:hypothetical protein
MEYHGHVETKSKDPKPHNCKGNPISLAPLSMDQPTKEKKKLCEPGISLSDWR